MRAVGAPRCSSLVIQDPPVAQRPCPLSKAGIFRIGLKCLVVVLLSGCSWAQSFKALSAATALSLAGDAYTTSRFRHNYDAWRDWRGPGGSSEGYAVAGRCMTEGVSPWLYGKHPGAARAWTVGAAEFGIGEAAALILLHKRSRFWRAPLAMGAFDGLGGTLRNVAVCR